MTVLATGTVKLAGGSPRPIGPARLWLTPVESTGSMALNTAAWRDRWAALGGNSHTSASVLVDSGSPR
jgi:hypothetical protein